MCFEHIYLQKMMHYLLWWNGKHITLKKKKQFRNSDNIIALEMKSTVTSFQVCVFYITNVIENTHAISFTESGLSLLYRFKKTLGTKTCGSWAKWIYLCEHSLVHNSREQVIMHFHYYNHNQVEPALFCYVLCSVTCKVLSLYF